MPLVLLEVEWSHNKGGGILYLYVVKLKRVVVVVRGRTFALRQLTWRSGTGAHGSTHVVEGGPEGSTATAAAPKSASRVGGEQKVNFLCGSLLLVIDYAWVNA